jgi:hypothetical protein
LSLKLDRVVSAVLALGFGMAFFAVSLIQLTTWSFITGGTQRHMTILAAIYAVFHRSVSRETLQRFPQASRHIRFF